MKKLLTSIILLLSLFFQSKAQNDVFKIQYANPLSSSQTTKITSSMINYFGACKPSSITVSPGSGIVIVKFYSPCMTTTELKDVAERTLQNVPPPNPILVISKSTIASKKLKRKKY